MPQKMPWYQKYFMIVMNSIMVWPTRRSNERKIKLIEDLLASDNVQADRGTGNRNLTEDRFCCALYWPDVYNKADEYHTVSSERACQNLVAKNQFSDYRRNLPPGPCER